MPKKNEIIKVLTILRKRYKGLTMLGSFTDKSPFQILIATVLSARSRDEQTKSVVGRLFADYPDAESMSDAPVQRLEKLVRATGFYRVKAARIKEISQVLLEKHGGEVPSNMDGLLTLPGVGRKTAGCVLVYSFKKPAIPVDTHVHRISNRLGWVRTKSPEDTEQRLMKLVPKGYWVLVNEVFVLHGQNTCLPITPKCSRCSVRAYCRRVGVRSSR